MVPIPLTDTGLTHLAQGAIGEAVTAFTQANSRLGVGDSSTAFNKNQTDLVAATNKLRKSVTSLNRTGNAVELVASFTTSEANWAWNEWGWFNAASAGVMLCRKVASLGTKTSAQTWSFTATVSFSNP